jgi:hypothetical protein
MVILPAAAYSEPSRHFLVWAVWALKLFEVS